MPPSTFFKSDFTLPAASLPQLPPEMQATLCASDRPLALFPVRLETRFFAQPDGSSELRVRVYPDKVHLDSHEEELTALREAVGRALLEQVWRAGNDARSRRATPGGSWPIDSARLARRGSCGRCGRSTWPIVPRRAGAAGTGAVAAAAVSAGGGRDRRRGRRVAQRAAGAPAARPLGGDRAVGRPARAGRHRPRHRAAARRRSRSAGRTPMTSAGDEQAAVDAGMRWMIDFDAAEEAGMALRIRDHAADPHGRHRQPVRLRRGRSVPAAETARQLSRGARRPSLHRWPRVRARRHAVEQHRRAALRVRRRRSRAPAQLRHRWRPSTIPALDADTNARRLGDSAGLARSEIPRRARQRRQRGREPRARPAQHEHGAVAGDVGLLPHATWSAWTARASRPRPSPGRASISSTHVRSCGPLPPIRCGRQPYGVLPVTSLDLWRPRAGEETALANDMLAAGLPDQAARQRLARAAGRGGAPRPPAESRPIPMRISPT